MQPPYCDAIGYIGVRDNINLGINRIHRPIFCLTLVIGLALIQISLNPISNKFI